MRAKAECNQPTCTSKSHKYRYAYCTHFAHRVVGQDSYYTVQLNIGTSRGGVKTIAQTANYGLIAEYMDSFKYPLVDFFAQNLPVTLA